MDTALLVAKLLGPVYLLVLLAVLMRPNFLKGICDDFTKSPGLMYLGGIMAFIVGLLIVNFHNVWVKDWTVLVTILGWLALLKGVMLLLAPDHMEDTMKKMCGKDMRWLILLFTALLGGCFTYMGYLA